MTRVSVIVPAYNCSDTIRRTIKSVLNQSYSDFELLIVDDCSTDGTLKVVKSFTNDKRVKCIGRLENGGPAAARNSGMNAAVGEFIAFLDSDDIFLRDKLKKQVDFFDKCKRCDILYTNESYFMGDESKAVLSNRIHFSGDIFFYLKRSNFISIPTVMLRKSALDKYRFDESLKLVGHEDWNFFLKLALDGFRFYYINEVLSKIRLREKSVTTSENMSKSREEVGIIARGYWKDFKKSFNFYTLNGQRAILRYVKLKTQAFSIGFPKKACFNLLTPHEILKKDK